MIGFTLMGYVFGIISAIAAAYIIGYKNKEGGNHDQD